MNITVRLLIVSMVSIFAVELFAEVPEQRPLPFSPAVLTSRGYEVVTRAMANESSLRATFTVSFADCLTNKDLPAQNWSQDTRVEELKAFCSRIVPETYTRPSDPPSAAIVELPRGAGANEITRMAYGLLHADLPIASIDIEAKDAKLQSGTGPRGDQSLPTIHRVCRTDNLSRIMELAKGDPQVQVEAQSDNAALLTLTPQAEARLSNVGLRLERPQAGDVVLSVQTHWKLIRVQLQSAKREEDVAAKLKALPTVFRVDPIAGGYLGYVTESQLKFLETRPDLRISKTPAAVEQGEASDRKFAF